MTNTQEAQLGSFSRTNTLWPAHEPWWSSGHHRSSMCIDPPGEPHDLLLFNHLLIQIVFVEAMFANTICIKGFSLVAAATTSKRVREKRTGTKRQWRRELQTKCTNFVPSLWNRSTWSRCHVYTSQHHCSHQQCIEFQPSVKLQASKFQNSQESHENVSEAPGCRVCKASVCQGPDTAGEVPSLVKRKSFTVFCNMKLVSGWQRKGLTAAGTDLQAAFSNSRGGQ